MEYTKETLKNTCIFCKKEKDKKKIIDFYKSFGYEYYDSLFSEIGNGKYIGPTAFNTNILVTLRMGKGDERMIINPFFKSRRKFPREMMVSENKISWSRRMVISKAKINRPFIALYHGYTLEDPVPKVTTWQYAKEID